VAKFIDTLNQGIAVGSLYALIALGYTLVYGILQFINFAHSDVFALGAWVSLAVASAMGLSGASGGAQAHWYTGLLVLLASMGICAAIGLIIERFAYRPLRRAPRLNVLITAIGVSLLLENSGQLQFILHGHALPVPFGPYPKAMPALVPDRVLATFAGGVHLNLLDVVVLGTAIVLMLLMEWLIFRTKLGLAMRAVSFNVSTASLMGINVDRVISITFMIGSALAAAAGFLYSMKYGQLKQTADAVWVLLGLKAFVAAVVGGIGNVRGAMVGGIAIGLIEFFGVAYLSSEYRDVYVFLVLILVLLLRPEGLLGRSTVEKV
jgi:branched-chain amino acid transport system permease protein